MPVPERNGPRKGQELLEKIVGCIRPECDEASLYTIRDAARALRLPGINELTGAECAKHARVREGVAAVIGFAADNLL